MTDRPSTAKRSPSILVTDVRQGQKSAPFVRKGQPSNQQGGQQGQGRFNDISIDNILSDVSEIPSAQRRLAPTLRGGDLLRRRGAPETGSSNVADADKRKAPLIAAGSRTHHLGSGQPQAELNAGSLKQARSAGSGGQRSVSGPTSTRLSQRQRRNSLPPRMAPGLPSRTTKMSERLVLIPEEGTPKFQFEDEDRPPMDEELGGDKDAFAKRSYAERVPKDKRTEKFPRVTAYCISDAVRLKAAAEYLRDHHKIKPRVYDEALFAPYYLPLLPGDEDGFSRVQSSPGGIQMLETLINRSEQDDHHYEYYSGLESSSSTNEISATAHDDENEEFDPSEPQDFSPQDRRGGEYMERHVNGSVEGHPHEQDESHNNNHGNNDMHDRTSSQEEAIDEGDTNEREHKETKAPDDLRHAEIFIFSYGVIVFWNFTEKQEKDILADMTFGRGQDSKPLVIRPIDDQDIETEDLHFTYSPETRKPRIYNDMITLKSGDHMIKLAMSHAIAQSTKLSRFEARMDINMHDVKHVPKMLALTGKLGMKREEILKMSGKLFKLRVDVNLSSNVLDTPEFFWEAEPSLNPMYSALREYLEIEPRILVLNERCKTFLELTDIIADSIAESNMARITWVIIILIALSLGVSTIEILIRFTILKENVNA